MYMLYYYLNGGGRVDTNIDYYFVCSMCDNSNSRVELAKLCASIVLCAYDVFFE